MATNNTAVMQLLAQMQAVENLRAQNAAAAQNLTVQLQNLASAQAQTRELVAQRRAQEVALASAHSQMLVQAPPVVPSPVVQVAAAASPASLRSPAIAEPPRRPQQRAPSPHSPSSPEPDEEEEVQRCHLHRKANKACKFCKAFAQSQEAKSKKMEERKNATIEKIKEANATLSNGALGQGDKPPLPNMMHFPQVMLERIHKNDFYNVTVSNSGVPEVKNILFSCETCDTESRAHNSLDLEPSAFICSVYRLLVLQLTEGQLQSLSNSRSCWIRCACYLYVRLGVHQDRYWDLLSDALMDDEEFVPFPGRGAENMSVGQYVEQLLAKDKYCNLNLPRIPVAQRRMINKRLVLYGQFRRRYAANLEVLDRFKDPGTQVEVCNPDGEWAMAETVGSVTTDRRCATVSVKFPDGGGEQNISVGMLICPGKGPPAGVQDLTRSRGRSAAELLERYQEQQRDSAVASGKDYCKTSGQHTMRVGGVPFVAGIKRKELEKEENSDDDMSRARDAARSGPSAEHRQKMAAIESKYCARVESLQAKSENSDAPERLRLG
mmetsp:Transcript_46606/g.92707  ORF Transcript_46606/g.92707 Transcript_46606/m.92707 type:complete len:550 (-) Transcript_46606:232-1881(-)|eukprot:CAMPEP_0172697626 /NCGR_PEP_ID=MMETSP1074-20121228/28898_1 /TAXON_ID=2916 /ORGANISM="Ceratium fusus, Strain PA161109" /LENGTH=549 /DNA_ID=CAMNT_0013518557 /DNA_START=173 /DNA_END=1822 /DNA_ORIENTATION=-